MTFLPPTPKRPILVSRMWLLLLFDAAERAGVSPLSVSRLHRLVYLANALAPVYDLLVPDGYILKYRRGPFFPEVHWDVGRLVAQGLLFAEGSRAIKDELGYWIVANYTLSQEGMTVVDKASSIETVEPKATFLREIALAFASIETTERDNSLLADVNYEPAIEDTPVYYGENDGNLAPAAVEVLLSEATPSVRRLKLHRYFQYLETAWTLGGEGRRHAS
jgi:hypothetical protein